MFFKDVIGQEAIKHRLIDSVKKSRVSHAQLFLGPAGSGKLAMAIAYVRYLMCIDPHDDDGCGTCKHCIKINNLAHPDLHFVLPVASTKDVKGKAMSRDFMGKWREIVREKKGYFNLPSWYEHIGLENKQGIISAEDCQEITRTLSLKSFEGEYKVMIIWMAERLFHSAAPKILKILEEPPDKTLFILIAENPDQILATILSRTQVIHFPRLDQHSLSTALSDRAGIDTEQAVSLAAMAEGNYLQALNLLDAGEELGHQYRRFTTLMRLCYQRRDKYFEITELVSEIAGLGREKQKEFLIYAMRLSRQCLLINFESPELVYASADEKSFLQNFHPFINGANGPAAIRELELALLHIERNGNPRIIFTDLALTFARLLKIKATA